MTLWDRALASAAPAMQEQMSALDDAVARTRAESFRITGEAEPSDGLTERVGDRGTAPAGIYGYGLWSSQPDAQLSPAIFVQPGLAPSGGAPLSITAMGAMMSRLGVTAPSGSLAVSLPPPQYQGKSASTSRGTPGMTITIGSRRATLGLPVVWMGDNRAALTAGHAASGAARAVVRDESGDRVGIVQTARCLDDVPVGVATADVAVISLDDRAARALPPTTTYVDAARPRDIVGLAGSKTTTWVCALSPAFSLNQYKGEWGHVAITAKAISRAGDSGAPVVRADGAVVGHLVAGYGAAYSLIQDIEYVVAEAQASLR